MAGRRREELHESRTARCRVGATVRHIPQRRTAGQPTSCPARPTFPAPGRGEATREGFG